MSAERRAHKINECLRKESLRWLFTFVSVQLIDFLIKYDIIQRLPCGRLITITGGKDE